MQKLAMVALILVFPVVELDSESVTLTTYYPAPSGVYTKMVTTRDTILGRDSGAVGIGTGSPTDKLHVDGGAVFVGSTTIRGSGARRGYLKIENNTTGCDANGGGAGTWPPALITGNTTLCNANQYVTFTPGVYIEGRSMQPRGSQLSVSPVSGGAAVYEVRALDAFGNEVWATINQNDQSVMVWCCPK